MLQLRYYDDKDDAHCKGFIDIAEVVHVASTKPVATAPKKADENSFFEVHQFYGWSSLNVISAHIFFNMNGGTNYWAARILPRAARLSWLESVKGWNLVNLPKQVEVQ